MIDSLLGIVKEIDKLRQINYLQDNPIRMVIVSPMDYMKIVDEMNPTATFISHTIIDKDGLLFHNIVVKKSSLVPDGILMKFYSNEFINQIGII